MSTFPSSSDWQIFDCQSCGAQMKARHNTLVQSRIFCPKCHTEVNILAVEPEFSEDDLPPSPAVHTQQHEASPLPYQARIDEGYRELPDPELSVETDEEDERFLENLDSTSDRQGRRKVKMRKRRKPGAVANQNTLTDWDTRLANLPEAEISADTWEHPTPLPEDVIPEKTRTYAVGEEVEDGRLVTRFKRIRRKRILGIFQAFFRRFTLTTRIAALESFAQSQNQV